MLLNFSFSFNLCVTHQNCLPLHWWHQWNVKITNWYLRHSVSLNGFPTIRWAVIDWFGIGSPSNRFGKHFKFSHHNFSPYVRLLRIPTVRPILTRGKPHSMILPWTSEHVSEKSIPYFQVNLPSGGFQALDELLNLPHLDISVAAWFSVSCSHFGRRFISQNESVKNIPTWDRRVSRTFEGKKERVKSPSSAV